MNDKKLFKLKKIIIKKNKILLINLFIGFE